MNYRIIYQERLYKKVYDIEKDVIVTPEVLKEIAKDPNYKIRLIQVVKDDN